MLSSIWSRGLLIGDVYVFTHFWDLSFDFAQNEWGAIEQLESGASHWRRLRFCALFSFIISNCAFAHLSTFHSIMRIWRTFSFIRLLCAFGHSLASSILFCAFAHSLASSFQLAPNRRACLESGIWLGLLIGYVYVFAQISSQRALFCTKIKSRPIRRPA